MANKVNEVTEKTTRFEVLIMEGTRAWMRSAMRQDGLPSESAYVNHLIAKDLTSKFGPGWSKDHPVGDQATED